MARDSSEPSTAGTADAVGRPVTIGRREFVSFVDWPVRRIRVKIDTGAFTSALDTAGYELMENGAGRRTARVRLALNPKKPRRVIEVEAPVTRMALVRSSAGVPEQRPVIATTIRLGPIEKRIEITLARRTGMRVRMLLGRQALSGDFLVDVGHKYLLRS